MVVDSKNVLPIVLVIGFVLVSLLLVYTYAGKGLSVGSDQRESLTVAGSATQTVAPDKAEVYVRIEKSALTSREAQAKGAQITDAVMNTLVQNGLRKEQIETSQYSLQKDEVYNPQTNQVDVRGYKLVQVLKLNIEDLASVGTLVDVSVQAGASGIDTIQFTLTKKREAEVKREVLALAAKEAKVKAESLAAGLGVSLGRLITVSESGFYYYPLRTVSAPVAALEMKDSTATQVPSQGIEVSATVNAAYAI